MKHYLDFIQSKNLQNNEIFSFLKCDENEGKILQFMAHSLMAGENDFIVHSLLVKIFHKNKAPKEYYLEYLPHIRNLIELGWVNQSTFLQTKSADITLLELDRKSVV